MRKIKKFINILGLIVLSFTFGAAGSLAVNEVKFSDVNYDSWYGDSVNRFYELGIFEGYDDNTYKPDGYVSRAELSVIFDRFLKKVGKDLATGGVCSWNEEIYLSGEEHFDGCMWWLCGEDGEFSNEKFEGDIYGCEEGEAKSSWEQ